MIWVLRNGPRRYEEIRDRPLREADGTPEITPGVLSRELEELEQNGLIFRHDHDVMPAKVVYQLTRKGEGFISVVAAVRKCAAHHLRALA